MTRRSFIAAAGTGIAAAAIPGCQKSLLRPAADKPNFIFILTDDLRYDAMGFMGHPFLKTPCIDRIRRDGAWLKNAFCTTSLCSPSRASFLTGTYAHRHGVMANDIEFDFDSSKTPSFSQILQKQAGYKTAFIGKWHMKDEDDNPRPGFDYWLSFRGQGVYTDPQLNENGRSFKTKGYITDILNDKAIEWLEKNTDKPFCLYLSHKAVHQPFTPAERHKGIYKGKQLNEPPNYNDTLEGKPWWQKTLVKDWVHPIYRTREYRQQNCVRNIPAAYPERPYSFSRDKRNYYETLNAVDDGIDRIIDFLEKTGQFDNTVIVFAGDNGFFMGEHRMYDKRCAYEESIRIPMVIRYPKLIKANSVIEQMVLNIDLAPTFLALAGLRPPQQMQGNSIVPLFGGNDKGWRKSFLYEYWVDINFPDYPRMTAVRTDTWKLVRYPDIDDVDELYDLKNDPYEQVNLINKPEYAPKIKELQKELDRLTAETGYRAGYCKPYTAELRPLVLSLDFNNVVGDSIKDLSGYGNDGIIIDAEPSEKIFGKTVKFSSRQYINVKQSESLNFTNRPLTIEVWVKAADDGIILSQGEPSKGGYTMFIENGIPSLGIRDSWRSCIIDGFENCIGRWTYLAAVIGTNKTEFYINGQCVGVIPRDRFIRFAGVYSLRIGSALDNPVFEELENKRFTGRMDTLHISRVIKTAETIQKTWHQKNIDLL